MRALLLAAALLLSGCTGEVPVEDAVVEDLPLDASAPPPGDPDDDATVHEAVTGFAWEAAIPLGVWACEGLAVGCAAVPAAAYGAQHDFSEFEGPPVAGALVLTWEAASPVTEELTLGAQWLEPGCTECEPAALGPDVTGPSPLTFTLDAAKAEGVPGSALRVWVYGGAWRNAGIAQGGASGDQTFQVEGTLVTKPARGGDPAGNATRG